MSKSYLTEAFKSLEFINEDVFDVDEEGIKELSDFQNADEVEDDVEVIDPEAETEDEIQDSYVGKVILDCSVCHSKLYKGKDEVHLDEEGELANVGEECPYCYSVDGFYVIGEVKEFNADETGDEETETEDAAEETAEETETAEEDEADVELDVEDDIEESSDDSNASLDDSAKSLSKKSFSNLVSNGKSWFLGSFFRKNDGMIKRAIDKFDVSALGSSEGRTVKNVSPSYITFSNGSKLSLGESGNKYFAIDKDGYKILISRKTTHDDVDDVDENSYVIYAVEDEAKNESVDSNRVEHLKKMTESMTKRRKARKLAEAKVRAKRNAINEGVDAYDVTDKVEIKVSEPGALTNKRELLNKGYKVIGTGNGMITMAKPKKMKPKNESIENISIDTGDQTIEVNAVDHDKEETHEEEVIAPLDNETIDTIEGDENGEVDVDIEDFSEDEFDELGEGYLKKNYANVESYKTTSVKAEGNRLVVEGMIKFNSGKEKKTSFAFESKDITKKGKARFIGENMQICRGRKAFTMTGTLNGNKFISESLNYNYRAKDAKTGNSKRVYGTIHVKSK